MQKRLALLLITLTIMECGLYAQSPQTDSQSPKYYVFNLGAPLGGNPEPVGINNLGWISGGANLTGNTVVNAELWIGAPLSLGTLGGPNSNIAWPNHTTKGEIVGIAETAEANPYDESWSCSAFFPSAPTGDVCLGFAWRDGVMTPLPALPGGYNSYGAGVNNQGEVVGWAENGVLDPTCNNTPPVNQYLQFEAVIWGPGLTEMRQLPPYPGDPDSAATAINDLGEVIGISGICQNAVGDESAVHALLWENGQIINLGNLGAEVWNTPISLNNRGQIVGFALNSLGNSQGFLWTKASGTMQPLPYIGDDNAGAAYDINENGQIVGISNGGTEPYSQRAFLYTNGKMNDLNGLVVGDTNLYLLLAQGINDQGEIVGTAAELDGQQVGFLAVPAYGDAAEAGAAKGIRKTLPAFVGHSGNQIQLTGFPRLLSERPRTK
jgi:probable HAF family extracellular repeat protein